MKPLFLTTAATAFLLMLFTAQSVSAQTPQTSGGPLEELGRLLEETDNTSTAFFGTTSDDSDLIILSHRFDSGRFSSEIKGEIMNNDTRSLDKFDIDIYANFRDALGMLVSSEQGFIDAEELRPGQSSAFNVFVFGDEVEDESSTYDLIINDNRVVVGQPLDESFSRSEEDNDSNSGDDDDSDDDGDDGNEDNNDNGNGNDDESGNNDGPLEELGDMLGFDD